MSTQRQKGPRSPRPPEDSPALRTLRDGRPGKPALPVNGSAPRAKPKRRAPPGPPPPPPPAPRRVPEILQIAAVCACVVVAAVASAVAVSSRGVPQYGARADILYIAAPSTPLDARDRALATQRSLIASRAVLLPVAARNDIALADLRGAVSVDAGARSDLLHITVSDGRRARALHMTQEVTAQYMALARSLITGAERDRRALERQIERLTARARDARGGEGTILAQRVADLQERVLQMVSAGAAAGRPRVLSPAYPLAGRLAPQPMRAAAAGLIAGLVLATGVAVLLARRFRRWPAP